MPNFELSFELELLRSPSLRARLRDARLWPSALDSAEPTLPELTILRQRRAPTGQRRGRRVTTGAAVLLAVAFASQQAYANDAPLPPTGAGGPGVTALADAPSPQIEEVLIDPPGADSGREFIELSGPPGAGLDNLSLLSLEGDFGSNLGQIDRVFSLANACNGPCRFAESGRFVLAASGDAVAKSSSSVALSSLLARSGLENGTGTLLLIEGEAPRIDSDLDPSDDGTLTPTGQYRVLDALAWLDGGVGDVSYAQAKLGPEPNPDLLWRCGDAWRFGTLSGADGLGVVTPVDASPVGLPTSTVPTPCSATLCPFPVIVRPSPDATGGSPTSTVGGAANTTTPTPLSSGASGGAGTVPHANTWQGGATTSDTLWAEQPFASAPPGSTAEGADGVDGGPTPASPPSCRFVPTPSVSPTLTLFALAGLWLASRTRRRPARTRL